MTPPLRSAKWSSLPPLGWSLAATDLTVWRQLPDHVIRASDLIIADAASEELVDNPDQSRSVVEQGSPEPRGTGDRSGIESQQGRAEIVCDRFDRHAVGLGHGQGARELAEGGVVAVLPLEDPARQRLRGDLL